MVMNGDKYIKAKIKLYNDKIDKSFHGNGTAKEDVCWACLPAILYCCC